MLTQFFDSSSEDAINCASPSARRSSVRHHTSVTARDRSDSELQQYEIQLTAD